ncbi:hypothetical protein D3C83_06940 [compost metagenome]
MDADRRHHVRGLTRETDGALALGQAAHAHTHEGAHARATRASENVVGAFVEITGIEVAVSVDQHSPIYIAQSPPKIWSAGSGKPS